jgi:hypothetical protein
MKCSSAFKKSVWVLFQQPGHWYNLASNQCVPPPIRDILCTSVKEVYDWGDRHPRDHSEKKLAQWLGQYSGINISHATQLEVFAKCLASSAMHNHPARVGKCKWETLRASMATQVAAKHSLVERMHQQLDSDLDKDTAAVASSSTIVVDDPTLPDRWEME